ncbi:MAG TPA: hypothetical protein VF530_20250 [Planctomycetota bacterium]
MVLSIAAFVVLVAFLGCLGLFALAVTKVVAPDGKGHARGLGGGCAALLALFLLCGLGVAGLAATVAAIGVGSVAEWNPIERIEIERGRHGHAAEPTPRRGKGDEHDDGEVSARFTVRGDAGGELVELLHDLVDVDLAALGDGLTVHQRTGADGADFHVYEFRLPISERELARLEHDLERELEGLRVRLPERVDIRFDGAE